jgi:hypothetical protein
MSLGRPNITLSGNSRFVAIGSTNLFGPVIIHDLIARTTQTLPLGYVRHLSLSGDGRNVVAEAATSSAALSSSATGSPDRRNQLDYHQHLRNRRRRRKWHCANVPANQRRRALRRVLQRSDESGLGDTNGRADIFVRDLVLGARRACAPGWMAAMATAAVSRPILAADGRTVVFHSVASDLVPATTTTSATSSS